VRILIVGGGKVGSFLALELISEGHVVTVVEINEERAQGIADDVPAIVLEGDGTNVSVLKAGDIHRTDWLLAMTGLDEVNLVACQLGSSLGCKKVLARLNNPYNRATFDALGIPVVGVTDLIVQVISQEIAVADLERIAVLGRGHLSLLELEIPAGFPPTRLRDLDLPIPSLIAVLLRGEDVIIPDADAELRPGDRITAVTTVANEAVFQSAFAETGDGE
jgi:trk system potassium uptake protein TrkA